MGSEAAAVAVASATVAVVVERRARSRRSVTVGTQPVASCADAERVLRGRKIRQLSARRRVRVVATHLGVAQANTTLDQSTESVAVHLLQRPRRVHDVLKLDKHDRSVRLGAVRETSETRAAREGVAKACEMTE